MDNWPTISHVFSLIYPGGEFSFIVVKTLPVQSFILLFCVWYESRELGGRGSSRFSCVTPATETFWERVEFRILSNFSGTAPLQKQPAVLSLITHCWAFGYCNWRLSSVLSVPCFLFFLRKWNFFVLLFASRFLNLSISFCGKFTIKL